MSVLAHRLIELSLLPRGALVEHLMLMVARVLIAGDALSDADRHPGL
ncbi:hypothetical protein [Paraburkholderia sp. HP33-1]|nr:hypothetical protein [Paraburkholderia sp. HP33-1]